MSKQNPINTLDGSIMVQGRIFWNDSRRRIELKKPIRQLFEPFESEAVVVKYMMELCLSKNKLLKRAEQLADKNTLPVLLYFVREDASGHFK